MLCGKLIRLRRPLAPLGSLNMRMIFSENRFPLFGIMRHNNSTVGYESKPE